MALPAGVPPLPPNLIGIFATPVLLVADTVAAILGFGPPQWGIYDQGNNPVIITDNVIDFDYKRSWRIADYPIEQGDFSTYDKVTTSFDARFTFTRGGSEADRATFLASLETIGASFDLYNVVTPEITYLNASVELIRYRRTADAGVGLITAEIGLKEIRQTATKTFAQTATPSGANQVNNGPVQPVPATPAQQSALSSLM